MTLENQDVKNEEVSSTSQQEAAGNQSAETLNSDKPSESSQPTSVPYERFKEINDKYRNLENQSKEQRELYEVYSEFDKMLATDPEKAIQALQENLVKSKQGQEQNQAQTQPQSATPTDVGLRQQLYVSEFNKLTQDLDEKQKKLVTMIADENLMKLTKGDPLNNFNLNHVGQAVEEAFKYLDITPKQKAQQYQQEKDQDIVPSSSTNSGQTIASQGRKELRTPEQRSKYLAEKMRAARRAN